MKVSGSKGCLPKRPALNCQDGPLCLSGLFCNFVKPRGKRPQYQGKQKAVKRKSSISFDMLSNSPPMLCLAFPLLLSLKKLIEVEAYKLVHWAFRSQSVVIKSLTCSKNKAKDPVEFFISVTAFFSSQGYPAAPNSKRLHK